MTERGKDESLSELLDKKVLGMDEYIELLKLDPRPARTAPQRVFDMIMEAGVDKTVKFKQKFNKYHFFDDPHNNGEKAIFGMDRSLNKLVNHFKSAAMSWGAEKRVVLLHGPVGTAKSTLVDLLKRGLERYSLEQPLYSFRWVGLGNLMEGDGEIKTKGIQLFDHKCEMHEEPLKLLGPEQVEKRKRILAEINKDYMDNLGNPDRRVKYAVAIQGDLCPACRLNYKTLMEHYDNDWEAVMRNHVEIYRMFIKEADRIGIGTFQPKDEKNQDSTELTGNMDFGRIALVGSDSDPRAFNFDGELNIANRGIAEFIEMLKLDVAFLYDLLSAQEQVIKPKKFPQIPVDEIIIGHTNEAEFRKLQDNPFMEALKSRIKLINIPYNLDYKDESRIYERDFRPEKVPDHHIAPHTSRIAGMWAVLSRLFDDPKANIEEKLSLYSGETDSSNTEDAVREMIERGMEQREGMEGVSPRYIQNAFGDVLSEHDRCINPFIIMNALEDGLRESTLITKDEDIQTLKNLIGKVKEQYEEIIKNEVQQAIISDSESLELLCNNYLTNVKAYLNDEKIEDPTTGRFVEPNEDLMSSIESKIDVTEHRKDEFRNEILNFAGGLAVSGQKFDYTKNEKLKKALELKLFEDQKDKLPHDEIYTGIAGKKSREKIDTITRKLIDDFGYCEICATDALTRVSSIIARENKE